MATFLAELCFFMLTINSSRTGSNSDFVCDLILFQFISLMPATMTVVWGLTNEVNNSLIFVWKSGLVVWGSSWEMSRDFSYKIFFSSNNFSFSMVSLCSSPVIIWYKPLATMSCTFWDVLS